MNLQTLNFQRFLRKMGWQVAQSPNERIVYLESPKAVDGDFSSVILPADMRLADAQLRLHQALDVVADHLHRSRRQVAEQIEKWSVDVINSRFFSRSEQIDSIPLSLATLVIDDLRTFVGYAAYGQLNPAKFYAKAGKAAAEFAKDCRFGHTFEGSFGLTIECPLSNVAQLSIDESLVDPPFERLVMQRIASGYRDLQTAILTDDPSPILEGYQLGMNANMMRALNDIYENLGTLQVEYYLDWSPEITPPADLLSLPPVKFDGRAHELVRYAADSLEKEEDEQTTTIVSYVVSLKSEMPLSDGIQDEFEHVITLDWERERNGFARIRVVLPAGEYKKACDAHKNGKKIQVSGIPRKEGKFWILTRPSEIMFSTA